MGDSFQEALVQPFPEIEIGEEFSEYNLSGEEAHEAGFDALMTGVLYLRLLEKLGK